MTTKKMGESQVISFFSTSLTQQLFLNFPNKDKFSIGDFSGSQDRKFADFFAGTDSTNILIEFKELKEETKDELNKPLRVKLCQQLTNDLAEESRKCHFIAWGNNNSALQVELVPYVDLVCQKYKGCPPLQEIHEIAHSDFITSFLSGGEGLSYSNFTNYIGHLNTVAGGITDGSQAPFKSILYSYKNGNLIGTRFENLRELNELMSIRPRSSWRP